ncbi:uncharacterized protein NPIL_690431 [Nephila pilipes]|uniref:Uncharacterized protein n=1 Tax=Nephila pilipes TaxID=299642 RepID=A0A8X6QVF5_NEPPI|nr:uncharacterized protein NPIL_690431 [Nephila pilipes]
MFFDHSLNQLSSSDRFMNLNVDDSEIIRLRRLMHENILKVEKENLETIHKELSSQKETAVKGSDNCNSQIKAPKLPNVQPSLSSKVKTATSKRLKSILSKQTDVKKASTAQFPNINTDHICESSHEDCQISSINFLNHFHSSFLTSKTRANLQSCDIKERYTPCAIPLAPPNQEKELSSLAQKPTSCKNVSVVHNNVVHHLMYEPKKLTIQTLPSISIIGRRPYSNENIKIEAVKERDYSIGDCIKTTILPALSEEVKNRISSTNLSQLNESLPSKTGKTQLPSCRPQKSVFTQSSIQDDALAGLRPEKKFLKEMIKEALQELQDNQPVKKSSEFSTQQDLPSFRKEENVISPRNDCELDSFIGDPDLLEHDVASVITPPTSITVKSNFTQTSYESFNIHHTPLDEKNMKHLIHEVITEFQQASPPKHYLNKETNVAFVAEKIHSEAQTSRKKEELYHNITSCDHKEVQVSPISEKPIEIIEVSAINRFPYSNNKEGNLEEICHDLISCVHKEVQVPLISEKPVEVVDVSGMNRFPDFNNKEGNLEAITDSIENPNDLHPIHQGEASVISDSAVPSELPTKLESVLNFIYNRFCRETGELSFDMERVQPSNTTSIQTREVSVQINPTSSSTKSTNTTEIMRIDAINQCDVLLLEEKDIKNVSIQVIPATEAILPNLEKVSSSVQCEHPVSVLKDSCVQTMEFLTASGNSANTSISSTPVSDSIFLDDMLSEGEIPWHLMLLSNTDKAAAQSSNNTTGTSDKEKDYSLSEGEIPPKYLQHLNLVRSPSYDSSSDTCTDPPRYPLTLPPWMQRSEGEINPETHQAFSPSACSCHCRTSSSSLSEGEIRISNSHLSEGEIPFTSFRQRFEIPPTLHPQSFESISKISPCQSGRPESVVDSSDLNNCIQDSFPKENRTRLSVDLSEGELEGPQMPYQSTPCSSFLDTLAEKK